MLLSSQTYGLGVRDPEKPFPDLGVKKAPDPGSGSATLFRLLLYLAPCPSAAGVHTRHTELVGRTRLQVHLLRQILVALAK
jgi:hypothetical protein